jgi:hypothetical protein
MLWSWSGFGWRWWTRSRQNVPRIAATLLLLGTTTTLIKLYKTPELWSMPGITGDYNAKRVEKIRNILDNKKILIIAERRAKMVSDKEEAAAYFAANGYTARATNEHLILQEYGH